MTCKLIKTTNEEKNTNWHSVMTGEPVRVKMKSMTYEVSVRNTASTNETYQICWYVIGENNFRNRTSVVEKHKENISCAAGRTTVKHFQTQPYISSKASAKQENYANMSDMDSFKDMTTLAIKVAASALFKKWLTSENFQKKLGPKLKEFMQKRFKQHLQDQHLFNYEQLYNQSQQLTGDLALQGTILDHTVEVTWEKICETFFTGLCGEGAAKVFEEVAEGDMRFMVSGAGEFIFRFRLWQFEGKKPIMAEINISRVLTATTSSLFGWLYDLFFGGVPTAETVMEVPKDPPLLPAKN